MKLHLHTPDFENAWTVKLSHRQVARLDNGHLVSIGLILGEDVQPATLKQWIKSGIATPEDATVAKHSGCQSRCILRGDSLCQW